MALVSQTLTVWAKVLQQSLPTVQVDRVYMDLVGQLVQGLNFVMCAFFYVFSSGAWAQMLVCGPDF